jgi:hypothetical protein
MIVLEGVDQCAGFLNPGCAILRNWKSGSQASKAAPTFPRFPETTQISLCNAGDVCEKRVPKRVESGDREDGLFTTQEVVPALSEDKPKAQNPKNLHTPQYPPRHTFHQILLRHGLTRVANRDTLKPRYRIQTQDLVASSNPLLRPLVGISGSVPKRASRVPNNPNHHAALASFADRPHRSFSSNPQSRIGGHRTH